MAKFRYSLQSILDIKIKMETLAKQDFSAARNALDEEEERLAALEALKASYEAQAQQLLMGLLDFRAIDDNKQSVLFTKQRILAQEEQVRLAERNLERAREALTEVMRERKTHETLREKAFALFMQEENRAEGKAVDELTSYTYGQRRKEEARAEE